MPPSPATPLPTLARRCWPARWPPWTLRSGAASADGSRLALLLDAPSAVPFHRRDGYALVLTVRDPDAAAEGGAFLGQDRVRSEWVRLQRADANYGLGGLWWSGDALCHHLQLGRSLDLAPPHYGYPCDEATRLVADRSGAMPEGATRLAASTRSLGQLAGLVLPRRPCPHSNGAYVLCSDAWKVNHRAMREDPSQAGADCEGCKLRHPFCCVACDTQRTLPLSDDAPLSMHTAPAPDGSGCALLFFPDYDSDGTMPLPGVTDGFTNQAAIVWLAEGHRGDAGTAVGRPCEHPRVDDAWLEAHDVFDGPAPPPPPSARDGPRVAVAVDLTGGMMPGCCTARYLRIHTYELALGPRCQCLVAMQGPSVPLAPFHLPDPRRPLAVARNRLRHTRLITVFLPVRVPVAPAAAAPSSAWPPEARPRVCAESGEVRFVPLVRLPTPGSGVEWPLPMHAVHEPWLSLQATPLLQFSPCGRWVLLYGSTQDRGTESDWSGHGADTWAGLTAFDLGHWLRTALAAGRRTQRGLLGIYYAVMAANPEKRRLPSYLGLSGLPRGRLIGGGAPGAAAFRGVAWTRTGFWLLPQTGGCLHLGARDVSPRPADMPGS